MTLFGVVWFNQSSPSENIAAVRWKIKQTNRRTFAPDRIAGNASRSNRVAGTDAFGNRRPQKLRASFSA
jgi:hypothetical protein